MQVEHGRLPASYNSTDADKLVAAAKKIARASKHTVQVDEDVIRRLAWTAAGDLSPMAAIFGGIVGQETVKAITGKFHPIEQFLYFDAVEALPSEPLSSQEVAAQVSGINCHPAYIHIYIGICIHYPLVPCPLICCSSAFPAQHPR